MISFVLFGVKIRIDFWFVAMLTLCLLTDQTGISVWALLACFIHELGHLILFFLLGSTPRAMIFELTGIRLVKPVQTLSPGKEALVQCGGSLANFLTLGLLLCAPGGRKNVFAAIHLLLGIFQLLPLKSLDGGKLLELFCLRFLDERRTGLICGGADLAATIGLLLLVFRLGAGGGRSLSLGIFAGGLLVSLFYKLRTALRRS